MHVIIFYIFFIIIIGILKITFNCFLTYKVIQKLVLLVDSPYKSMIHISQVMTFTTVIPYVLIHCFLNGHNSFKKKLNTYI
jgi:hypothetical protein